MAHSRINSAAHAQVESKNEKVKSNDPFTYIDASESMNNLSNMIQNIMEEPNPHRK